jgi:hypothetical protein
MITSIVIKANKKCFFTSSSAGELKQWDYNGTLLGDHGRITDKIWSLCI